MFENYIWWRHKLCSLDLFSNKSTVFYKQFQCLADESWQVEYRGMQAFRIRHLAGNI